MSTADADRRADRLAAHFTGVGIGLIAFMVIWTIGARITERLLDKPTDAFAAMAVAAFAGVAITVLAGRRLSAGVGNAVIEASPATTHADIGRA